MSETLRPGGPGQAGNAAAQGAQRSASAQTGRSAPRARGRASERDAAICTRYLKGETLRAIGERFGLSYEGVRRIVTKAGLTKHNAGLAARNAAKAAPETPPACERIYGCSMDQLARIGVEERQAFLQHRKNARRHGVDWRLSLPEWYAVWRASGKWDRRGQGPRKYGMTRIDLDDAVELGNVQIVSNREAVRRARLRAGQKKRPAEPRVRPIIVV